MTQQFVIFALPRSRTAWLSQYLTYGEWSCGHDSIRFLRSMDDVRSWFVQPCTGTVETAGAPWWRLLAKYAPDVRVAVVRRPVADVVDSLVRMGFERDAMLPMLRKMDRKLDQIERRVRGVLSVTVDELATEDGCARLFRHCLPYEHDPAWWAAMSQRNVQINMVALVRYYAAHWSQLEKLSKTARHVTLAAMRRPADVDGIMFRQESLAEWRRDGPRLFEEHSVVVGESPQSHRGKHWLLMEKLESLGALQITTARSNGRMFGYLMTVISPALESPEIISATNTFFYASPEFPGLGMKLQAASARALKERGVTELLMRAGTRGSGPRLGVMYRRMGAEVCGTDYLLQLKDVA